MEAGFDYSIDSLPDPAVWEQMLHKSPIRHVAQVRHLPPSHHLPSFDHMTQQCLHMQVRTPVLLTLGEDDKRVPNKQGVEFYRALKAKQVPVR